MIKLTTRIKEKVNLKPQNLDYFRLLCLVESEYMKSLLCLVEYMKSLLCLVEYMKLLLCLVEYMKLLLCLLEYMKLLLINLQPLARVNI